MSSNWHRVHICTKFCVVSSSHFPFRVHTHTDRQTNKVTDATDHPTHGSATSGVGNYCNDYAMLWADKVENNHRWEEKCQQSRRSQQLTGWCQLSCQQHEVTPLVLTVLPTSLETSVLLTSWVMCPALMQHQHSQNQRNCTTNSHSGPTSCVDVCCLTDLAYVPLNTKQMPFPANLSAWCWG